MYGGSSPRSDSHASLCPSIGKTTTRLLLSFLALSSITTSVSAAHENALPIMPHLPVIPGATTPGSSNEGQLSFSLRHILHHGTHKYPGLLRRHDVGPADKIWVEDEGGTPKAPPKFKAKAMMKPIQRLQDRSRASIETYFHMRRFNQMGPSDFPVSAWVEEEITQPNITDKESVIALAKMAADAYVEVPRTEDWLEAGAPWNVTGDFGWEDDGLRGHVFVDDTNTTLVIGVKGTSIAIFEGPTTGKDKINDKINDNLLFSCCCARVGALWSTVCDCYSGTSYTCNSVCLKDALNEEDKYYAASRNLYYNITAMYPNIKNVWVVGHSLGGSLSSLMGQTFGIPAVAFQAPGEALASSRLGLPAPPAKGDGKRGKNKFASALNGIYHFGHTADPIFMGTCNGLGSGCSLAGYAMETHCHAGHECVYDVVNDHNWRVGLGYHRIQVVIRDVLEKYDTVAACMVEPDCIDCFNWKFIDGNEPIPEPPTTTTKVTTTTSCTSKGWWGCLDPTTTTTATTNPPTTTTTTSDPTTTTSTSTSTTSCTSYGWFGNCLDPVPTTTTPPSSNTEAPTTTAITTTTTSTACEHYGWWGGCLDEKEPSKTNSPPPSTSTQSCEHPGWFGGCNDPLPTTTVSTPPPASPTDTGKNEPQFPEDEANTECSWFWYALGYCKTKEHGPVLKQPSSRLTDNEDL
ncbi:alpha/beta-hydrolase [Ascobolus immersus RN42]|uniref:triacylglycerol lipase n=1 Tax=Ascobolus immersus RN42 TaxID=1160509 RepID=A0A3N4IBZ4_ASCIM|nr:alpha/beta-hydrolase [Ascobolus immersus RN42]